jgi:lambda family phage portal protein
MQGLKRAAARNAIQIYNSGYGNYGANLTKKSMRGWEFYGGSSKEDIEDNLDVLRQRSRDAYMGVPIASAAIKTMRTNVVAGGLMLTPQIDAEFLGMTAEQSEQLQAQIVREFAIWAENTACDADRVDDFYRLQQLAFLNYCMNGDAIALLPMIPRQGQPYDLRIRLIEADRVSSPDGFDRLFPCEVQGFKVHSIVQGVETDESGEIVAYWICNRHPLANLSTAGKLEWTRVEAYGKESGRRNVLHVLNRERAGQVRGVPMLAPVLESLKQLGRYTQAEIDAALVSAMMTLFVTQKAASDVAPFGEMLPKDQLLDSSDRGSFELAPGAIVDLRPGEEISAFDPKHPITSYDKFTASFVTQIGAALEIPGEVIYKQFNANYSASRGALNEFWRACDMQRDWFASCFCQPIYEEWFAEAVARGRISAPGFFEDEAVRRAYTNCTWNGPSRTSLNPKDETEAAIMRVQQGFSTAEQETAQMTGGIWAANMRQRKIEAQLKKEVDDIAASGAEKQVLAVQEPDGKS